MDYRNNANELTHHGILGMKWGVRRYQNKDGSLTPAGKRKAAKMKEKYTELTGKRLIKKPTKKVEDQNDSNKKKHVKDMTINEINARIERLKKEKDLTDREAEMASNSKKFISAVGKQVLAPAAVEAGKKVISSWLEKQGKELLGLNTKDAEDAFKALEKEAKTWQYKKQIVENKNWLDDQEAEEAKKDSKKDYKKDKAEYAKVEIVDDFSSGRNNKSSRKNDNVIIDEAEYVEEILRRYKSLPVPKK